jgi:hypothetical protein
MVSEPALSPKMSWYNISVLVQQFGRRQGIGAKIGYWRDSEENRKVFYFHVFD